MKKKEIYSNKQVAEILGLTPRQVLSWTEKGLINAFVEPTGYGTRRGYNYTNLLEFGLCKVFFFTGFGFRVVKNIFNELNQRKVIHAWATNFKEYHDEILKNNLSILNEMIKKGEYKDGDGLEILKHIKKCMEKWHPDKTEGVLVYSLDKQGLQDVFIIPWNIESLINLGMFKETLTDAIFYSLIDLGKIKKEIDSKI